MRKLSIAAALLALLLIFAELGAFAVSLAAPNLFDHREFVFSYKFTERKRTSFVKHSADPRLGWDNPESHVRNRKNCLGQTRTETYGAHRQRVHSEAATEKAKVVVAGDSYVHGDDVEDADTFPAALERQLGVPVINLGVGGFGPTQALLKLESSLSRFPAAEVAVLSIMHDNLFRMVNSYRPVYFPKTGIAFGFKPFMKDGAVQPMIAEKPWEDLGTARKAAHLAFDTDHWRKPVAKFPFLLALTRALTLPAGQDILLSSAANLTGKNRHEMIFEPLGLEDNLTALLERFHATAKKRGLSAIVALVPRNGQDSEAGAILSARLEKRLPKDLTIVPVGRDIDWQRYNLKPDGTCHPSVYGYKMIADALYPAVLAAIQQ